VIVLVDDLQWLDPASRECVTYAARRARGPVALLLAERGGRARDGRDDIATAEVRALDDAAAAELLGDVAPELAPDVRDSIVAAAAGNPLALVELPTTLTAEQRSGAAPLQHPLAPGRGLERVYSARLAALPEAARTALLVAAASHSDELAPVDAACRALGCSAGDLQTGEDAGLARIDGHRLAFAHPLVRGAAYHGASASERRAAHRALAEGADGEARAWHLANGALGADDAAAEALEQVAYVAAGRRAYAAAADALERSARLTGDNEVAAGRVLGAAVAALSAGRAGQAAALADEAHELAPSPLARVSAQHLRGVVAMWSGRVGDALGLLEQSANGASQANPTMAAVILADASFACSAMADCARALALAERAVELLGDTADPAVRAPVLGMLAWTLILSGDTRAARPVMAEVQSLADRVDPFSPASQLILMAVNCRLPTEDYDGALADGLERAARARDAGSLYAVPTPLGVAALSAYRLGRWDGLAELCDESIAAAEETDQWGPASFASITRARLAAARGDEARCRADAESAAALGESAGVGSLAVYAHGALGFLELSAGRVELAIAELELTERLADRSGLEEPTIIPWAPDLIEAYVRAGRTAPAQRVLATLSRQADRADTAGAAALAERCRGLLAEDDFDAHFELALEHDARAPMPFERARTLLAWGMRLHRARRRVAAREQLKQAVTGFEDLGAAPWAQRARAELRAAGGRQRQPLGDSLTGQEERVARAAGRGATTREIAAQLFLSPKTVEFHLGRVYRKLGVRSRAELATVLAEAPQPLGTAERASP
jgi:DNA-binding CsgD family transcriptional regulator